MQSVIQRVIKCSRVPFIIFTNTLQTHFLVHENVVPDSCRHSIDPEAESSQGNRTRRIFPSNLIRESRTDWACFCGSCSALWPLHQQRLTAATLRLGPDDDCCECLDTHPWPGALLFCGLCCQGIHNNTDIISITPGGEGGIRKGGPKTQDPGRNDGFHILYWGHMRFPFAVV